MRRTAAVVLLSALLAMPPATVLSQQAGLSKQFSGVDRNKPVLCLLPGRVRKLGGAMTYQERRKPEQLTASECEIRGGEYTLYDRANYETALALWQEEAAQGSAEAHLYVGEIYERGWLGQPDYATAAQWYAKAAALDNRQAERRLAYFYEQGLGVDVDKSRALDLWRSALGLQEGLVLASELEAEKTASQRRVEQLLAQLEQQNQRTGQLQGELASSEAALAAREQALREQRAEVNALEQQLQAAARGAGDPQRARALEAQLAEQQAFIDDQQLELELLEAELIAQRARVSASERQADTRERQLQKAQEELLAMSRKGDAQLVELAERDARIEVLERDMSTLQAALADSREREQRIDAQLSAVSGNDARVAELRKSLDDARTAVADGEARLAALRSQASAERAAFEQQLGQAAIREADLTTALAASREEKARLAASLGQLESRLTNLTGELTASRHALADREVALAELKAAGAEQPSSEAMQAAVARQESEVAGMRAERDRLLASLQATERERDELRGQLASQVDTNTWLSVELESATNKLARAREELRMAELALDEANFNRRSLQQNVRRLEEDMQVAQSRSEADILSLRNALSEARQQLAEADASRTELLQVASRLESDIDYYSTLQEGRTLAMRGEEAVEAIPASAVPGRQGNYHAIIIANYDYDYLQDLSSPPFDANRLKRTLESRYGFDVTVLINLNRSEMYAALAGLRDFDEDDHVLVYYAGHGRMDDYGEGYWLPVDYRGTQPLADSISAQDLSQTLNQSNARHVLVVADSCYSGALARDGDPVIRKSVPALVKFWLANRSRTVLTSGGLKPVLDEGPGKHSVFASALLETLEGNQGALNGEMLHANVYSLVRREAAKLGYLDQKPQFSAIEDAGHENGQFVFLSRG